MEKICSWFWKQSATAKRQEDAYWYDNGNLIVVREGQKPEDSTEIMDAATLVMPSYLARGYEKLTAPSQKVYDFLRAKGF